MEGIVEWKVWMQNALLTSEQTGVGWRVVQAEAWKWRIVGLRGFPGSHGLE